MQSKQLDFLIKVKNKIKDKNLKYFILTMGCQLNENDSEKLAGMLYDMGYVESSELNNADIIVFNTCCVRENAEERLFGKLGEIKNLKESRDIIIAIGGCMMQEKEMSAKIKKSYPYVDIVFGTHTLQNLPENVYKALIEHEKVKDIIDIDGEIYEGIPIKRSDNFKASVTIMYGCNNFCSYCIVPYVRGRERSRNPQDILKEIEGLAKRGYKEITLLGQNVNSYMAHPGADLKSAGEINSFAKLLDAVCKIDGIEIVRFISPHPKNFTDDVIDAIARNEKIARVVHLPLQSGNSKVLREMNRNYTKEQFIELAEKMKKKIPNVVFSTDIIVGFPGETEEEFEDTLDVVRKINFEQIFMFIYSAREGTPAAIREDQIPEEIKHNRFDRLKELYDSKVNYNNQKYLHTKQKILIEGFSKNNSQMFTGRTDTNKVVVFEPQGSEKIGDIIMVEIEEEHKWYLKAKIVKKEEE